jgi:subtilase family serine protease
LVLSFRRFAPVLAVSLAFLIPPGLATADAGQNAGASAAAAGSANGAMHSQRVCAAAPVGYAACHARVVTDANLTPLATTAYSGGYSPDQLQAAYGLTGMTASTTVAIVDAYANPAATTALDLAAYRNRFSLGTADLTQYNQTGGTTLASSNASWGLEEMLDLEMISAICPHCKIIYVGANSASFNDLAAAVDRAAILGATVISNSYGGSEFRSESLIAGHYSHPGVAITVSSGDSGYGVQIPAAFNTVTAVGGTTLKLNTADNTRLSETVWSGAGSGCSSYISKPAWQHDSACARRTVADVAAVADPYTGVAVYDSYGSSGGANWYVFGGTSVAAPIIGAVYALSGNTTGVPASLAYAPPKDSLFDVTSGSNGLCVRGKNTSAAYLCTGVGGYDGPTGNGTPNGTGAF